MYVDSLAMTKSLFMILLRVFDKIYVPAIRTVDREKISDTIRNQY